MEKNSHVFEIDPSLAGKMTQDLEGQGFEMSQPQHTLFKGTKKGINCTFYKSGKCVVQGKESKEFIEFYLEPHILGKVQLGYEHLDLNLAPRIGIDESGKGDFFGPLCIAGVFAEGKLIQEMQQWGVRDSKALSDSAILKLADQIRKQCTHHIVRINPAKYNEIYPQFGNLNKLLAWGHATSIEQLVLQTHCKTVTIDQFANEHVVLTALKRKKLDLDLTQRHRGEEDIVVAAASILARAAFLAGLKALGEQWQVNLPKGASAATIAAGKKMVAMHGKDSLGQVAKLHFKTLDAILP